MNLDGIKRVYFAGIGGIGMSALARFFHHIGKEVAGYDRTATTLTRRLEAEGMSVHYEDDLSLVPSDFIREEMIAETLVIYTPAVPAKHRELTYFKEHGFTVMKRAQVLGLITHNFKGVAIAGSHGKSTVTAMTAHIFSLSELGCSAFLGAISKNADSNLLLNRESEWAIMEADEFDRSFLHLKPAMAVVTSMDPDHLDIYGGEDYLRNSFEDFLSKAVSGAPVVIKTGLNLLSSGDNQLQYYTYGFDQDADFHPVNIRGEQLGYVFDLVFPEGLIRDIRVTIPGWINIENAVAAASMALLAGVSIPVIRQGIETFEGVKRRFDIRYRSGSALYLDDYAHHPKEISALIQSVRKLFPDKRILGVFQPHLFTRTRDFAEEFASELSQLDELLLMEIYPAREEPIEGVTSGIILDQVTGIPAAMVAREELLNAISNTKWDVLLTIGAGDIDTHVEPITKLLHEVGR